WATMGASLGGLIAVHLAWQHPDLYGWALPRSGAFDVNDDQIISWIEEEPPVAVGFHCVVGTYEWLTPAQERFVAMLARTGYEYAAAKYPEGHNWTFWSAHI